MKTLEPIKAGETVLYGIAKNKWTVQDACSEASCGHNYVKGNACNNCATVINVDDIQEHKARGHRTYTWCSGHGPEIEQELY